MAYWFQNAAKIAKLASQVGKKAIQPIKRILHPALTRGEDPASKALHSGWGINREWNRKLISLGQNSKYTNPKKISIKNENYMIKTTKPTNKIDPQRSTVVVEIKTPGGKKIYQPFYRSTGTGVPEMKSKGNWLPFEGHLPAGMEKLFIKTGKNKGYNLEGPSRQYTKNQKWYMKIKNKPIEVSYTQIKDLSKNTGLSVSKLLAKNKISVQLNPNLYHSEGWLIKAYKNSRGELIDSSIRKPKRGMPIHEEIDLYLRKLFN
jgi:hypothetical protein